MEPQVSADGGSVAATGALFARRVQSANAAAYDSAMAAVGEALAPEPAR